MELKLKIVAIWPVGGLELGGWTEIELILVSTQIEVVVKVGVELDKN